VEEGAEGGGEGGVRGCHPDGLVSVGGVDCIIGVMCMLHCMGGAVLVFNFHFCSIWWCVLLG
jgi:hypothetical protein